MRKVSIIWACFVLAVFSPKLFAYTQWLGSPEDTNWNNANNWNGGVLPTDDKAGVKTEPVGPIIETGDVAVCKQLTLGGSGGGTITINGGVLNIAQYAIMGNVSGENGTLILNSGEFNTGTNFYVGFAGTGTAYLDGGTVSVGTNFGIGDKSTGIGTVYLGGSVVTCTTFRMDNLGGATAKMDIALGTLIVDGDEASKIQTYIDDGWIVAFDSNSTLEMDYDVRNPGKTTLTAVHPLNIYPEHSQTVGVDVTALRWNLPEPSTPGGVVTCDVYYGTELDPLSPNYDYSKVISNEPVESYAVTLESQKRYYWKIDVFEDGVMIFDGILPANFDAGNAAPDVDPGGDITAWLIGGQASLELVGTVVDDGGPVPYTVLWAVAAQPEGGTIEFTPPSADTESVRVVCSGVGDYVFELTADDSLDTGSGTVTVHVFENACEAAQSLPDYVPLVGDLNGDCRVDEADLVLLVENWLQDNSLEEWFKAD